MEIDEFIKLSKERVWTDEDYAAFEQRVKERAKEYERWEKASRLTNEFLNREYTI